VTRYTLALVAALIALSAGSHEGRPAPGSYTPCGLQVGTSPIDITFPGAGFHGPPAPTVYLALGNGSSGINIWFNAWGGTAAPDASSWLLAPGFGFNFNEADPAVPQRVSVVSSAPGGVVECFYR
jgi:hypothetical protein